VKQLLTKLIIRIKKNRLILLIVLFYFVFRLINLTKLPIFNDEAIYLDWGFRETHRAGFLYYSLYDAKQPFLMWIFGVAENIFSDPLFAGRLISVCAGLLTLVGIYKLSKEFFTKEIGLIAAFLYCLTPLFSFYDRQALMESAVAAVGIWAGYFILKTLLTPKSKKFPIFLGITLGIGFFIKSSSLLFLVSGLIIFAAYSLTAKKVQLLNSLVISMTSFLVVIFFLLINPQFWETLPSNARYSLTLKELLNFPFNTWINTFIANLQIGLTFITPLVFLLSILGIAYIFWKKDKYQILFLSFFMLPLLGATLLTRIPSDRYVVSFLPFVLIPAAYLMFIIFNKQKIVGVIFTLIIFSLPLSLTLLQIINPPLYLLKTLPYAPSVNSTYLDGFTSGYGINETVAYLQSLAKNKTILIGIAENTGNPESALITYFNRSTNVKVVYFAPELFPVSINNYDCIKVGAPLYFVARDEQLTGLSKFLQKIKTVETPYGKYTIGIYTLKKNCAGKTLNLNASST
jgi:4-amino-4-deoxy-L-arabinose transferase-like glycosyltransferase